MSVLSLPYILLVFISSILTSLFARKQKTVLVLLFNIAFLYLLKGNLTDVIYIIALSVYTWITALFISEHRKKYMVILANIIPVLGLIFYKYNGYFMDRIAMPLGLSFYTFKAISYITDVSRRASTPRGLLIVFDYLGFFPTFMAGPIHRFQQFVEQLEEPTFFSYRYFKKGFLLVALGLFEKLVIADELSHVIQIIDQGNLSGWYVVLSTVLYAFHIYVDFDAYSNIAIGSAKLIGFDLDRNFAVPYTSKSMKEFWNRWHISLSTWLRDYVYIPLGGNRNGYIRKYINILIVFMISGLWHGNTKMFLVWGLGHAVLRIVEDLITKFIPVKLPRIMNVLLVCVNFILVSILWIFFRASSMTQAISQLTSIVSVLGTPFEINYEVIGITYNELMWVGILMVIVVITDLLRRKWDMLDLLEQQNGFIRWGFYTLLMLVAIIFGVYGPGYHAENFIYVTF